MGQQLQILAVFLQDNSLVPNTHFGWFTTTLNSILGDLMPSSGFHGHLYSHMHMLTHMHICPIRNKISLQIYTQYISRFGGGLFLYMQSQHFFLYCIFYFSHHNCYTHYAQEKNKRPQLYKIYTLKLCQSLQPKPNIQLSMYIANKIVCSI